ncbi:MAG: GFA family protein [Marinobacter sp.]|uniref:GFA family protein n=1 Tax=Marinobacter sp. TaxID=50741 RepID=UPI00299E5A8F|nr:GFA family protein [Marinobacter sp.]MDX1757496.1 GFA family protein [Marinobacter sp.]
MASNPNCQCACSRTRFQVNGKPLIRGFCHCSICQAFNQADYGDITVFRARDVVKPAAASVDFHAYRVPPIVQRGKCVHCGQPAIEYLTLPPLPELVVVPTANLHDAGLVPEPSLHIFYETRVADVEDTLPKYSGYLRSQLAFGRRLMGALLRD